MAIEGIDPYSTYATSPSPPPEENAAPPPPEEEVIKEENVGNTVNTTA